MNESFISSILSSYSWFLLTESYYPVAKLTLDTFWIDEDSPNAFPKLWMAEIEVGKSG